MAIVAAPSPIWRPELARVAGRIVGLTHQEFERALVMPTRLTERTPSPRGIAGSLQVVDRLAVVAAELEVEGKLRGDLAGSRSPGELLSGSDPAMEGGPPTPRDPTVECVAEQRVHELEVQRAPVVGRCRGRGPHEPTAGRVLQRRLRIVFIQLGRLRDHRKVERVAHGAGSFEDHALARRETGDLPLDNGPDAVGDPEVRVLDLVARVPPVGAWRHHVPLDEVIEHGAHEQRIASSVAMDLLSQPLEGWATAWSRGMCLEDVRRDRFLRPIR